MFKRKRKPKKEPLSVFKAAQLKAAEKLRGQPPLMEPGDPSPENIPLFWTLDDMICFPLHDDDQIIDHVTGEIRHFNRPAYDAKGRRIFGSSVKAHWRRILINYYLLGVITGAILCYIFMQNGGYPY